MYDENIVTENLALINFMIKKMNCKYETEDEYQEYYDYGLEGLIRGAKTYNESKGKLSSYLCKCIANSIARCFYFNTTSKRSNPAGRNLSLNYEIENDDSNLEFGDLIPDPNVNIEEEIEKNLEKEKLIYAINKLKNSNDALAIKYFYGLDGYEELGTYQAVAERMGVTKQMIQHRIYRARRNLKKYLEKNDRDVSIKKDTEKTKRRYKMQEEKKTKTLQDLNEVLFEQIDKLNDKNSDFEFEIRKSYAVSQLAQQIVANTNTQIKAMNLIKKEKITEQKELLFLGLKK